MQLDEKVKQKIEEATLSDSLSGTENRALLEAEKLADEYADVKPDTLTISPDYLMSMRKITN